MDEVGDPLQLWRGEVRPDWIDANQHVHEGWYAMVFGWATDEVLVHLGAGPALRSETGGAFYTIETHQTFLDALTDGAAIAVDTVVIGADPLRLHLFHELLRLDDESVVATQEVLLVHVDTTTDRMTTMPATLLAAMEAIATSQAGLIPDGDIGRAIIRP